MKVWNGESDRRKSNNGIIRSCQDNILYTIETSANKEHHWENCHFQEKRPSLRPRTNSKVQRKRSAINFRALYRSNWDGESSNSRCFWHHFKITSFFSVVDFHPFAIKCSAIFGRSLSSFSFLISLSFPQDFPDEQVDFRFVKQVNRPRNAKKLRDKGLKTARKVQSSIPLLFLQSQFVSRSWTVPVIFWARDFGCQSRIELFALYFLRPIARNPELTLG